MKLLVIVVFTLVVTVAQGTVYTRCEIARILRNDYAFTDMNVLSNWICLIQWGSSFNDRAVGSISFDGTQDFGLFHINNKRYCQGAVQSSNNCGIACIDLLGNLTASVRCAKIVYQQRGFRDWNIWTEHCQQGVPSVADCF